jgi:hypothetical protein
MRLLTVTEGQVVKNAANGSFYRFTRPEGARAKIRPLELFPNGRLLPKPTDTTIDDCDVVAVGGWHDPMYAEGKPKHGRQHYERELSDAVAELAVLEIAYEQLPVSGTGKQSRGSWANKLKNVRSRIEVLRLGLATPDGAAVIEHAAIEVVAPDLNLRDVVQLPSGLPALILGFRNTGGQRYATVRTKSVTGAVPCEVLRPWSAGRLCTV